MRTQYYTAASLDGFIATVDDSLEWLFPLWDINETSYPQFIQNVGALAMATYEWMAAANGMNLWLVGGGELVGQFYDAGLLDEIIVQVGSVTLGSGKPLLPRPITSPPLKLVSAQRFGEGFAELRYEVPKQAPRIS